MNECANVCVYESMNGIEFGINPDQTAGKRFPKLTVMVVLSYVKAFVIVK